MTRSRVWCGVRLLAAALVIAAGLPAVAQSTFGGIVGTVKDPSGSVVPGACVTVTNRGTSATPTATTSPTAADQFLNRDARTYQVKIQANAFDDALFDHLP